MYEIETIPQPRFPLPRFVDNKLNKTPVLQEQAVIERAETWTRLNHSHFEEHMVHLLK